MTVDPQHNRLYARADQVDEALWSALRRFDPEQVVWRTGALWREGWFEVDLLGRRFGLEPQSQIVLRPGGLAANFQEALVLLGYLSGGGAGLSGRRVPFKALSGGALFFTKSHALPTETLAQKLDLEAARFAEAGRLMGARPTALGDASWLVMALPQVPLEAVFFSGDEEFRPRINLLVDASAERYLDLGQLWALVNLLARRIKELS